MDIAAAFLNRQLEEDIYCHPAEGDEEAPPNCLIKLNKSLYGLKQAPYQWFQTIDEFLREQGFVSIPEEKCLYLHYDKSGEIDAVLALYVDVMLLAGRPDTVANQAKQLGEKFEISDMGVPNEFLGIKLDEGKAQEPSLVMYTDASFRQLPDGPAIYGYLIYVNNTLVSWGAKASKNHPKSTFEAEIGTLKLGLVRFQGSQKVAEACKLVPRDMPKRCLVDNMSVVKAVTNQEYNGNGDSAYLMGDIRLLQTEVKDKVITVEHVRSEEMNADILTKCMPASLFERLKERLPMAEEPSSALPGLGGSVNL